MNRDDIILNAFVNEIDSLNKEAMKKGTMAGLGLTALAPLLAACPKGGPCPSPAAAPKAEAKVETKAPAKTPEAKAPEGRSKADIEKDMRIRRLIQETYPKGYPFSGGLSEGAARTLLESAREGKWEPMSEEHIQSALRNPATLPEEKESLKKYRRFKDVVEPHIKKEPSVVEKMLRPHRGAPRGR